MKNLLYALALSLITISACSDPSSIGASILGSEELSLDFTDQIDLDCRTVLGDSLRITSAVISSIGMLDEPIFGPTENLLYLSTSIGASNPDFSDAVLDSIVMTIPYDILAEGRTTTAKYGDSTAVHHIELFQLDENIFTSVEELTIDSIFTTTSFAFDEANLVGERTLVPNYIDSVFVKGHNTVRSDDTPFPDSLVGTSPELRIRLDNSFGDPFFADPENIASDSIYQDIAKGFLLRTTPSTSSMIGLNFQEPSRYEILYYYTKTDDNRRIYSFDIAGFTSLQVTHDYETSGSAVAAALADGSVNQDYLFIESYDGTNIEVDLQDVIQYDGKVINAAILEFTVAEVPDYDIEMFELPELIVANYINEEGVMQEISDVASVTESITNLANAYGGIEIIDEITGEITYRMNITNHVIQLLRGDLGNNYKIYLSNRFKSGSPRRVVFNGNDTNGPAPKLNLVVTEP